jgi:putative peptide-modifying radical SAM enzyme
MFYHVILTTECNSHCSYCYGEALQDFEDDGSDLEVDYSLPKKMSYSVEQLARFCARDPYCVLTFYGGEPLLCIEEIKKIMDETNPKLFMMQTNGLLLDRLEPEYVNRFHTILVSIDGHEGLTDFYRGEGTFRKVINNAKLIIKNGFKGELIARMTVMENTDIYKEVRWLLDNNELSFPAIHWQLNAGFWKGDFERRDFKQWSEQSYNPDIQKLVQMWVDRMKDDGQVLRLYPLLGIAESLLSGEKSLLRCGGGWINYAIQTDGHLIACPTMWGMKKYYSGHISSADPSKLRKFFVTEPCVQCDIFDYCGGRCLYSNAMKRWSSQEYSLVCNTVRNLVEAISQQIPEIQESITKGTVRFKDFEYIKFNGCEIIP